MKAAVAVTIVSSSILLFSSAPTLLSCSSVRTTVFLLTIMAFVAGIMIYISLDEILPLAHRYGQEHLIIIGLGIGKLVMAATLAYRDAIYLP